MNNAVKLNFMKELVICILSLDRWEVNSYVRLSYLLFFLEYELDRRNYPLITQFSFQYHRRFPKAVELYDIIDMLEEQGKVETLLKNRESDFLVRVKVPPYFTSISRMYLEVIKNLLFSYIAMEDDKLEEVYRRKIKNK